MAMNAKTKTIASIIIALIIGAGIGYGLTTVSKPTEEEEPERVEYLIGAVSSLTGTIAYQGTSLACGYEIALDEINEMLEETGSNIRFKLILIDDKSLPEESLKAVKELVETHGAKVIIGPLTSGCVLACKGYIDSKRIPMLGPASSSAQLNLVDYIFRTGGSTTYTARVTSDVALTKNPKAGICIYRNDVWGSSLADGHEKRFKELGLPFAKVGIQPDIVDYSAEVAKLSEMVTEMGKEDLAIFAQFFESDLNNIFALAAVDPVLSKPGPSWYGYALFPSALPPDSPKYIADWLIEHNFIGMQGQERGHSPAYNRLFKEHQKRLGEDPYGAAVGYDGIKMLCMTILQFGYDSQAIYESFPYVFEHYYGTNGWSELDENGDAVGQDYIFTGAWKSPDDEYKIMVYGAFDQLTEGIEWYPEPQPMLEPIS